MGHKNINFTHYKNYIFDFDNTLVYSEDIKQDAFITVCEQLNIPTQYILKSLQNKIGRDRKDFFEEACKQNNTFHLLEKCLKLYSRITKEEVANAPEVEGTQQVLKYLHTNNKQIFINSATPQKALIEIIKDRNWDFYFSLVLGRPSSKVENCIKIFEQFKTRPNECLFIGDSLQDYNCALELNMNFLGINPSKDLIKIKEKITIHDNFIDLYSSI